MIALIPARAGSQRLPGKNLRPLAGHPLLAYAIVTAQRAHSVSRVIVSTEDDEIAGVAVGYGAEVIERTPIYADHDSPDIDWVREVVVEAHAEHYALLRCTSPFRTSETIERAHRRFLEARCDSLRAVELVEQHPGKMWWYLSSQRMVPLHPAWEGWSRPTQTLPPIYIQNASLEIFHRDTILKLGTLSGHDVCPFVCPPPEGYDLNTMKDWAYAERMVASGAWSLPALEDN